MAATLQLQERFVPWTSEILQALETDGCIRLPKLIPDDVLREMQQVFDSRLQRQRWNNCDGYERGERLRLTVPDVLTLSQGFVDLAIHPVITSVLNEYLGPNYSLCEAKGWRSLPTNRDFHGWHGDMWYDKEKMNGQVPREVKIAMYLSDVNSGAFQYIKGSHGKTPFHLRREDVEKLSVDRIEEFTGPAGTVVMFDTSGIHRQAIPILEPRDAIFYNYHDTSIPLQKEDVDYYRYHPLLLNAAFLSDMTPETMRIFGFGDKTHYQPAFVRKHGHSWFHNTMTALFGGKLFIEEWSSRVFGKLGRMVGRK